MPTLDIDSTKTKKRKLLDKTRCDKCNKKLSITQQISNKCLCENYYCNKHKFVDKHDCQYDFQEHGRKELEKHNPVIKKSKVERF